MTSDMCASVWGWKEVPAERLRSLAANEEKVAGSGSSNGVISSPPKKHGDDLATDLSHHCATASAGRPPRHERTLFLVLRHSATVSPQKYYLIHLRINSNGKYFTSASADHHLWGSCPQFVAPRESLHDGATEQEERRIAPGPKGIDGGLPARADDTDHLVREIMGVALILERTTLALYLLRI
ncbi:hypothetical protein BO79DRAFT_290183 [Aspergillus costaricaensis CBS 115574]|uniref:Uncharacterized protein n=1 Tax=Aspergillus costaricaensis CBS 115574 TaxID=1448317 RepID=A0ACD1I3L2_9EURO|nr:hypothetical protein BO79DRAFT_290183 [Aspergillus costaricaensis CBS 115574]RAK84821.1 hypothetical protein BO79DRAFT_290183 [Aspergillus costaricaensis CBS 115574]